MNINRTQPFQKDAGLVPKIHDLLNQVMEDFAERKEQGFAPCTCIYYDLLEMHHEIRSTHFFYFSIIRPQTNTKNM